ncbi:MAG: hypothetical protein IJR89_08045 [Clostridia bacterium]|nr:hypothetical protein [Clostridia bacterium]
MNPKKRKTALKAPVLALLFLFLLFSEGTARAAGNALALAASRVLPSLLPFMVLSSLLLRLERASGNRGGARSALLLGVVCGVPIGATLLSDRTPEEKERFLPLASLISPSFCLSFLGGGYKNPLVGALIFLSSLLGAIASHALLHCKKGNRPAQPGPEKSEPLSLPALLTSSVGSAVSSAGSVTVCIVFFSCLSAALSRLFDALAAPAWLPLLLTGLLEASSGCGAALALSSPLSTAISAFFIGFGGLSAAFQALSAAGGARLFPYLFEKLLTALLTLAFWLFFSLIL